MVEILIALVAIDIVLTLLCLALLAGRTLPPPGVRARIERPADHRDADGDRRPLRHWSPVREHILELRHRAEVTRRRGGGQV